MTHEETFSVTISEGISLSVDPRRLLDCMDEEQKLDMVSHLSCDSNVIQNVVDQIIHGCFIPEGQGGWFGWIDAAQREIAKHSSEIYKREIERMEREVEAADERAKKGWDEYHKLSERSRGTY